VSAQQSEFHADPNSNSVGREVRNVTGVIVGAEQIREPVFRAGEYCVR
jgi:hypothetical protein